VPNELLVGSVVQNESYSDTQMRIALPVQVAYDSDLERAMAIMVAAAQAQPRVLADPAPAVLLKDFADSGINLELGVWIADPGNGTGRCVPKSTWRSGASSSRPASSYPFRSGKSAYQGGRP
jgi:small-conductance mechanosensitive channel